MKEFFSMHEPTPLARIMGGSLNASIQHEQPKTKALSSPKKKRRIPRGIRELRDRDGIDIRDLVGL